MMITLHNTIKVMIKGQLSHYFFVCNKNHEGTGRWLLDYKGELYEAVVKDDKITIYPRWAKKPIKAWENLSFEVVE